MCNHEDRPCCGCLSEEYASDLYADLLDEDLDPFFEEYFDPETCDHENVGWISTTDSGTYGTCDDCGEAVKEDAVGRWELN